MRERPADARGLRLTLDDEGAEGGGSEVFLGKAVFDEFDHLVSPLFGILKPQIIAISAKEEPHRGESGAFIPLFESVRLGDPGHQPDGKSDYVLLSIRKSVLRTR